MSAEPTHSQLSSTKYGLFATLSSLLGLKGVSAPLSSRAIRVVAPVLCGALALLVLTAAPALAYQTHVFKQAFGAEGSGAGQLGTPEAPNSSIASGLAVNDASGDLYVADTNNHRVDQFSSSGAFIRAWGWGVKNGAAELQSCTEATGCQAGLAGLSPGQFESPNLIAIDNSGGPSQGDVYVGDRGHNLVTKFDSAGSLISNWGTGGQLNGSTATHGPFGPYLAGLAVDSSGDLDVLNSSATSSSNRIIRFAPDGSFLTDLEVAENTFTIGLAISPGGNFFKTTGTSLTDEVGPGGALIGRVTPGQNHTTGLAVDSSTGTLYDAEFNPDGSEPQVAEYAFNGAGEVILQPFGSCPIVPNGGCEPTSPIGLGEIGYTGGVAVNSVDHVVYVIDAGRDRIDAFAAAVLPDAVTEAPSELRLHSATLHGSVNPVGEGASSCRFAWGPTRDLAEPPVPCEPETFPNGSSPVPVHAALLGLQPGTTYFYRLLASNSQGTNRGLARDDQQFTTPGAGIHSTSVSEVSTLSATLEATIDPNGDPASYHFEYDTVPYAENGSPHGTSAPLPDQPAGSGGADVEVAQHIQGLSAATTYHYRVVVSSEVEPGVFEPVVGPDRVFTTQPQGGFALPDNRAWELVSPPDKRGANLRPIFENGTPQAAADGSAVTYLATAPTEAEPPGNATETQVLSARDASGAWQSRDISGPHSAATGLQNSFEYVFFSADLSRGLLQPQGSFEPSLSPAAAQQTPFLRNDFPAGSPSSLCATSCYWPLLTACPEGEACPPAVEAAANVPSGTEFGEDEKCTNALQENLCGPQFAGASADLGHVVLTSVAPLTPGAPAGIPGGSGTRRGLLYEWSGDRSTAEQLELLTVRPNGIPIPATAEPFLGTREQGASGAHITRNAISTDGSRVVFSEGPEGTTSGHHLYLRYNAGEAQSEVSSGHCTEPERACTLQLDLKTSGSGTGPVRPVFQTASNDGSVIFFTDTQRLTVDSGATEGEPDLYECKLASGEEGELKCDLTDLTPSNGAEPAAVLGGVPGASEDGSFIYFVTQGVLANAANPLGESASPGNCQVNQSPRSGSCNLYLRHAGQTIFIASLSAEDFHDWGESLASNTSRVSPDGRWLAFMSERSLTGYDNRDASSEEPDQEVYLYRTTGGEGGEPTLVCASCNPTGARPHGVEYHANGQLVSWSLPFEGPVAASLPGWMPVISEIGAHYQPRYLSNAGRLFFNSSDALVPQDSNGTEDVYQYEPTQGEGAPPGDTCAKDSPNYSPNSGGCVDLISSGTSPEESAFLDASESGDDVFFLTQAQLSRRDEDTSRDFYDARSGGGEPQPIKPVECEGDGCQRPAAPPNDPTPGSLTFNGAGNLHETKAKKKHKSKKHRKKKSQKRSANHNRGGAR